jgi:hypothetical protein
MWAKLHLSSLIVSKTLCCTKLQPLLACFFTEMVVMILLEMAYDVSYYASD